jgi:hypothetical protein
MQLLHRFDDKLDAQFWLATNGYRPWAKTLDNGVFMKEENYHFVKLHYAAGHWLVEEPTDKTT